MPDGMLDYFIRVSLPDDLSGSFRDDILADVYEAIGDALEGWDDLHDFDHAGPLDFPEGDPCPVCGVEVDSDRPT